METGLVSLAELVEKEGDELAEDIARRMRDALAAARFSLPPGMERMEEFGRLMVADLVRGLREGDVRAEFAAGDVLRGLEAAEVVRVVGEGYAAVWDWLRKKSREGGVRLEEAAEVLGNLHLRAGEAVVRRLLDEQEKRADRFQDLLNRVRSNQDWDSLLKLVVSGICECMSYRRAAFFLHEHDMLDPVAAWDVQDPEWGRKLVEGKKRFPITPLSDTLEAQAFYHASIRVTRAEKGTSFLFITPEAGSLVVLAPVQSGGNPRGMLYMEKEEGSGPVSKREREMLQVYADTVSMALENARLYREVVARRRAMDHLLSRVNTAYEEERARIARELHDSIAQSLLKIIYTAGFALDFLREDPSLAVEEVEEVQQRAKECLQELRTIMANLRPTSLDILGLKETIIRYAEQFEEENNISTTLELRGIDGIPPSVELTAFRILQEELTNVRKHSRATEVKIRCETREGDLILMVEDNGVGFDPEMVTAEQERGKHLGLMAIRERAELLGGELSIDSVPGRGTRITVRLPTVTTGEGE